MRACLLTGFGSSQRRRSPRGRLRVPPVVAVREDWKITRHHEDDRGQDRIHRKLVRTPLMSVSTPTLGLSGVKKRFETQPPRKTNRGSYEGGL
jgi:hypothetical protein